MLNVVYFVGLDLAWGPVKRTGIAIVDEDGCLRVLDSVITNESIADELSPYISNDCLVAIDAPLLVTNESGRRPAEAQLDAQFRSFQAGPYPAFRAHPTGMFDPPRGAVLAQELGLDIDPQSTAGRRAIEVYPHPAIVALFRLGCTLKYKSGRGLTAAKRMADRRREMLKLIGHVESLANEGLPMRVIGHDAWKALRDSVESAVQPKTLNLAEDQIDAVLCAYIAMFFTYRCDETMIFGNFPENGYIVTPSLPPGLRADCPKSLTGKSAVSEELELSAAVSHNAYDRAAVGAPTRPPSCPCGCGESVSKVKKFVPGHDSRALHQRIAQEWGNTLGFIEWFDETYGFKRE